MGIFARQGQQHGIDISVLTSSGESWSETSSRKYQARLRMAHAAATPGRQLAAEWFFDRTVLDDSPGYHNLEPVSPISATNGRRSSLAIETGGQKAWGTRSIDVGIFISEKSG